MKKLKRNMGIDPADNKSPITHTADIHSDRVYGFPYLSLTLCINNTLAYLG